jgi:Domain of unknown function (DUF4159)
VKKAWVVVLLVFLGGLSFLAIPAVVAEAPSEEPPEFYFTRLMYTQNRNSFRGGGGTLPNPGPYRCPEFGGGNFFPPQGHGWLTDSPGADCKLMGAIHRMTGQSVYPNPNYMEILNPELFKYPYAYIVEPGQMYISDKEAERLREYLLRGGFLHMDDFWGPDQLGNAVNEIRKVFPDREFVSIPLTHPIFHSFFDIPEIIQTPNVGNGCDGRRTWEDDRDTQPRVFGISDDNGRLMIVMTYNTDLGDAWEYMDRACYPQKYTGYALRMGLNLMTYAVTH